MNIDQHGNIPGGQGLFPFWGNKKPVAAAESQL
jgi:hypothetical protein